jgi:predicted O-methyltransferase YrrM
MYIIKPKIDKYLESILPPYPQLFKDLEAKAREEKFPIVGPQVGQLLEILTRAIKAKRILELGSGFGYSGLWFARALSQKGEIILTDFNDQYKIQAEENFKKVNQSKLMTFMVGDSLKLMDEIKGPFDIIFNDVDKEFYPQIIEPAFSLLKQGGLFITDNTLWYGKVTKRSSNDTLRAIKQFNLELKHHKGFTSIQIPLRDGLSISLKR